jgi:DNA polymerase (family 10)
MVRIESNTLFRESIETSALMAAVETLEESGAAKVGQRGDKALRLNFEGVELPVDLYIATDTTWPTLLLIRTGSREHNILLCSHARRLGMQLKADGSGLLRNGEPVATESEEDIFAALSLRYLPPERREDKLWVSAGR